MSAEEKEREELVDIYDDELRKIGVVSRYEAHRIGAWHFNFHCWVVTHRRRGSVLFQVRGRSKPTFPGLLDSTVGGHFRTGEKSPDLVREVDEEIGSKVSEGRLVHLGRRLDVASYGGISKREIAEVFLLLSDRPLGQYRLEKEEIGGMVEVGINEGLALFSGKRASVSPRGLIWDDESEAWEDKAVRVDLTGFVPKMDSYYLTLMIMAQRFLRGEKPLSI